MKIEAVAFDVGETLVDETRAWSTWADWLGVPRLTFFALLGAVLARGGDHREVFEWVRPGIDLREEARRLGLAGRSDLFSLDDLYPDALEGVRAVAAAGYRVALAGNQPAPAADVLREMDVPFELVATSAGWGVAKPEPAFFERLAEELRLPPAAVAYVGDRLDNDVRAAKAAGMAAIWIRRGPWAWIQAGDAAAHEADAGVDGLLDLVPALRALDA